MTSSKKSKHLTTKTTTTANQKFQNHISQGVGDSFGQTTPPEIQKYLKTKEEYETGKAVIQRNTDIVQHVNTHVCGHLCLLY